MTSPITPISLPSIPSIAPTRGSSDSAAGQSTAAGESAENFAGAVGDAVASGLDRVNGLEQMVTEASQQAAVGNLESVSDYMIASAEAQLATEITVAVRDRAITAFNDIMRMQI